jgi:hypothetical protein
MSRLTPSQKGAVAEAAITAAVVRRGLVVLRPFGEGARYDLAIDVGRQILRVQCKWAAVRGGVLCARTASSRHTPSGYVRNTYGAAEVDATGLFAPDTGRCYLVPIGEVEGLHMVCLRRQPTRNRQAAGVRWASSHELERMLPMDAACAALPVRQVG